MKTVVRIILAGAAAIAFSAAAAVHKPASPDLHCTSIVIGGTVYTNCY